MKKKNVYKPQFIVQSKLCTVAVVVNTRMQIIIIIVLNANTGRIFFLVKKAHF